MTLPGLGAITPLEIVLAVGLLAALGWAAALTWQQRAYQRRLRTLLETASGVDLETMLTDYLSQVQETTSQVKELNALAHRLQVAARHSLQHMGVVRFNPFSDTGGDQSFAVALVDGHGNGVVIASLHAREGTRVYAKPLKKWESEYRLTEEEKQAIALAYQQQTS
ncbi:MAG: DUF4446 family protein [Chloroflexi bacterium]|nr:DUF4446 family protein [Chloroflexota bacterium]